MADSILGQILEATKDDLRDNVTLTGIEREHIHIQPIPENVGSSPGALPFITVSSFLAESFPNPGTNVGDDYGYPISIFIVDRKSTVLKDFDSFDRRLVWRENIMDRFIRNKFSIAATGTVQYDILIEPSPIVDISAWFEKELFVSPINLRAVTRVTRRT
jgi:hypothetical protein